jgi:hypothetical protein
MKDRAKKLEAGAEAVRRAMGRRDRGGDPPRRRRIVRRAKLG